MKFFSIRKTKLPIISIDSGKLVVVKKAGTLVGSYLFSSGDKYWIDKDKKFHNYNGPAIEWLSGVKYYYIHGQLHRDNGPAIEGLDFSEYYYFGKKYNLLNQKS